MNIAVSLVIFCWRVCLCYLNLCATNEKYIQRERERELLCVWSKNHSHVPVMGNALGNQQSTHTTILMRIQLNLLLYFLLYFSLYMKNAKEKSLYSLCMSSFFFHGAFKSFKVIYSYTVYAIWLMFSENILINFNDKTKKSFLLFHCPLAAVIFEMIIIYIFLWEIC